VTDTIHLRPTDELAERVLLPGDPGRALLLAQALLDKPRMFNHNRGLWGYTGLAADGAPLTVQSTGMGGPSSAIIVSELSQLGARRMLRVGTCGGLDPGLALGGLLVATEALADDGTSRSLGAGSRVPSGAEILARLIAAGGDKVRSGPVVSTDLFYDTAPGTEERWRADGALAVEMEAATLFQLAARNGFEAGAALIVSDLIFPARERIGGEKLQAAELALGQLAVSALPV
jgi:DeoD family purine-nucleoside phosphorylase